MKFGKTELGLGFAFAGEKLLHQPFFMGLERVHFPRLRGGKLVNRTQALGYFWLFGGAWSWDYDTEERLLTDVQQAITSCTACDVAL